MVQYKYDAWGNVKTEVIDEAHAGIAELNPFRYRSYYYDPETNLYYLNTRYYDPEVGRFISQDDVSYLDPEHINGLNLFAYCGNNPVMGYDPDGTWDWGKFWATIAGIVSVTLIVVGAILTATGVGGIVGGILLGAGIGGLCGLLGNIFSQGVSNGFNNINWGQVAFNSVIGMGIGAVMGSPLGAVASGVIIGGIGFIKSVGNDLFDNNGNINKVDWVQAVITGVGYGVMSGIGKGIKLNMQGVSASLKGSGFATFDAISLLCGWLSIIGSAYATIGRGLVVLLGTLYNSIFGGKDEKQQKQRLSFKTY